METLGGFLDKLASMGVKLSAAEPGRLNCYAPKGALTKDIKDGIAKYKTELLALLEKTQGAQPRAAEPVEFPLSVGQKGLYILQKLHPAMGAYNVPLCFRIHGAVDADLIERAWGCVLDQYPILTARVVERDGVLYQQLHPDRRSKLRLGKIDCADDHALWSQVRERVRAPFDLDRGPLTRIELLTESADRSVVLLTIHHIIFDGTSAVILMKALGHFWQQLREGKEVKPSRDLPGYGAFVAWEEAHLASAEGVAHAAHWRRELSGDLPILQLPSERARGPMTGFEGETLIADLPSDLSEWIREFAKAHSVPVSVIFLSLFQIVLQRYSAQEEVIVGMPVMGRAAGKFAAEVGYFINMVPLRLGGGEDRPLGELLHRVRSTMLEALYHSSYPFPRMLEALSIGSSRENAVFQVMYAFQNFFEMTPASIELPGARIESVPSIAQAGESDLALEIYESHSAFQLRVKFNPEVYGRSMVGGLLAHYRELLDAVRRDPGAKVADYSILTAEEKHRLAEFNETRREYPQGECLHDLFVKQAGESAGQTAVACGGDRLTYGELEARSAELALYLQSQGVGPDALVGVCMERTPEMVVGLLGVLRAGGAYVPLDTEYPGERMAYMVKDSGAALVLTESKLLERLGTVLPAGTRLIALDGEHEAIGAEVERLRGAGVELKREVGPQHLAYVIYTSGSTGQPKGVAIEHHSPVTLVHWAREVYGREELAGVLAGTSICFDLSVYEIFVTLASGGTVILVRNALGLMELAEPESVTLVNTVPSAMEELVRAGAIPRSVRTINLAGEPLSPRLVDAIYEGSTVEKVYDLYGPSEDTTYSTYALRTKHGRQTIGRPIANTRVYVLDRHGRQQPIGVPGDLHISGEGLARGYLNREDLTKEKFVPNPYEAGGRMYRTGDLARWLEDGKLEYLGRIDTQVKIRGFRIELGEIEAGLKDHPEIQDAAVIAHGEGADRQLTAFYRAKATRSERVVEVPADTLREHLSRKLPEYMVPPKFVSLEAIPLSPNGKVDRRALARMDVTQGSGQEYVAPRNETEKLLVEIWAEVLNRKPESIGVHDSFFEMGGHSLLAAQMMAKAGHRTGRPLPLDTLFTAHTISSLAKVISSGEAASFEILAPIRANGDLPPVFAVPGVGGNVLSLRPLSGVLGERQPLFALQAVGLDGQTPPFGTVEETAAASISAMRRVQGEGPYSLIGHSYGGVVAFEIARQLLSQGEGISSLVLLDSLAPAVMQSMGAVEESTDLADACVALAAPHGVRLEIDVEKLRGRSTEENIQYVVARLREHGVEVDPGSFAAFFRVRHANLLSYGRYRPSPLGEVIDVRLYRATEFKAAEGLPDDYGWNELLQRPARVQDVEADHFSILAKVRITP